MKILGIDPGYDRLGIAIIEKTLKRKEVLLYSECFTTSPKETIHNRLCAVGKQIKSIIEEYKPNALAIESLFITKNQKTAMHVSEARGIIMYEANLHGVPIYEYTPPQIKVAVTGDGKSDKNQIIKMIPLLLDMPEKISKKKASDDEYDAIAVAITCFAIEKSFPQKM